jgi:hypothetical protein
MNIDLLLLPPSASGQRACVVHNSDVPAAPRSANQVVERMRHASLDGVRLLSDRPKALSPAKGGFCFQLSARPPRPRSEKASTIASSSDWHGLIGFACGCRY